MHSFSVIILKFNRQSWDNYQLKAVPGGHAFIFSNYLLKYEPCQLINLIQNVLQPAKFR